MIKVGFSKIDLEKALLPDLPIREERIEAVSFYAEDDKGACLWIVLDFMDFNLLVVESLIEAVAKETGIIKDNIHIVTTHNHGGGEPEVEILASLVAKCAKESIVSAKSALMRYVFTSVKEQVNILRRIWIPEINGVGTLFYGASRDNGFDSAPFVEKLLDNLSRGEQCYTMGKETQRPYLPFPPGDEELAAVQFCDIDGGIIGSVVRFSAHAVCCNRDDSYSSDYPFHVRKTMEECCGGIAMFLNGPCGDIAPAMNNKYDGTEKVLGEYLAKTAIDALDKLPFEKMEYLADGKLKISLPVNPLLLDGYSAPDGEMPCDLAEKRRYLDRRSAEGLMDFLQGKYTLGEDCTGEVIDVSVGYLMLGDLTIAAFPGETFSVTGRALQEAFPGVDICTVTEHGRTVMYLPPYEDSLKGSYESVCRTTDHCAEAYLRKGVIEGFEELINRP